MKKLVIIVSAAILLGGCSPKELFFKPPAGLEITTNPASTVFLNDQNKGSTPFSDKSLKPGTYTLKLVPNSGTNLTAYETSFTLTSHASTVISRNFSESELDTTGYTLELQQENSGETYVSVISDPDTVNVTIDGKPSGFTPLSKVAATPGAHSLLVTSPGYIQQELSVNTVKGYNLIVNFKLGSATITLAPATPATASAGTTSIPNPTPNPSPTLATSSAATIAKPYVLIGETGTGWLRVRKDPKGDAQELGKADTGEKLKYLGETTDLGWHKVEFVGTTGWVSAKYVTLVK